MKRIFTLLTSAAFVVAMTPVANAAVISAGAGVSSAGTNAQIIGAPAQVNDSTVFNSGIQVFNEKQGVNLIADILFDAGSLGSGMRVDSHMIFLNKQNSVSGTLTHRTTVSFGGLILGVMSDVGGSLEAASNSLLGAMGTIYPGAFNNRGLEGQDNYTVSGNSIDIGMFVTQPGDWVRVVTVSAVPVPGSLALLGTALVGAAAMRRRKKSA